MNVAGFLLLLAGWSVLIVAIVILPSQIARSVFVLAGLLVEFLGVALVGRYHRFSAGERE